MNNRDCGLSMGLRQIRMGHLHAWLCGLFVILIFTFLSYIVLFGTQLYGCWHTLHMLKELFH